MKVSIGSDGVSLLRVQGGEEGEEYNTVSEFNEIGGK
jgi:hypothetical protein